MIPGLLGHAAVLAAVAALGGSWGTAALVLAWSAGEARLARGLRGGSTRDTVQGALLGLAVLVGLATGPGAPLLVATGAGLRLWAVATLGASFHDAAVWLPGQARVGSGPYRVLRHPAELGSMVLAAGCCWGSAATVLLVPLAAVTVLRIRAEEVTVRLAAGSDQGDREAS